MTSPFRDWLLMMGFVQQGEVYLLTINKPWGVRYNITLSEPSKFRILIDASDRATYLAQGLTEHQARELIMKWIENEKR